MAALTPQGPAIAKLVDSGYGRAEAELPLDINYQKLTEWLVSRKKMPGDWHKRVAAIQAKISEAAKDLPPGLLAALPGGADAPIDYFRAVAVRDKLAEGGERTLFGGLAGPAALWDAIVKAYEKQNVFMGEAASSMVANVDYELPYLRKQAARYSQLIADAERRASEYVKSAATCAANFKQECARLGISGSGDVRAELRQLGRQLPGRFQEIVDGLRSEGLGEAIAYYRAFVDYAHNAGEQQQRGEGGSGDEPAGLLPTLAEVRAGTTAPPATREPAASGEGAAAVALSPEVDWDAALNNAGGEGGGEDGGEGGGGGGGIDWDLDLADLGVGGAEEDDPAAAAAAGPGGGSGGDDGGGPSISWDIELTEAAAEDAGAAAGAAPPTPGAAEAGTAAADAPNDEATAEAAALRLAYDGEYRAALGDDLAELRAFLAARESELRGGGGGGGSADLLAALLPPAVAAVDGRGAGRLRAAVEGAVAALNDPELRQLLLIAGSARYLDRLAREVGRKAGQEAKMLAAAKDAEARRHESRAALAALAPRSAALAERTRAAQQAVQAGLSAQLGRRVNVLGEINNALAAASAAARQQQQGAVAQQGQTAGAT